VSAALVVAAIAVFLPHAVAVLGWAAATGWLLSPSSPAGPVAAWWRRRIVIVIVMLPVPGWPAVAEDCGGRP